MCRVRVRRSRGRARPWKLAEGCHLHLRRGRASRDTAWETGRASANEQSERGVVGGGDCSARRSLGQENTWRRRFRRKLSMHTRRRGAAQLLSDRCTWHGAVDSLARDDARNQAARVRLGAMLSASAAAGRPGLWGRRSCMDSQHCAVGWRRGFVGGRTCAFFVLEVDDGRRRHVRFLYASVRMEGLKAAVTQSNL